MSSVVRLGNIIVREIRVKTALSSQACPSTTTP